MSCCAPGTDGDAAELTVLSDDEVAMSSRSLGDGSRQVELSVPAVHCAACINAVESTLREIEGVEAARVNLSTRRVTVRYRDGAMPPLATRLAAIGYPAHPAEEAETANDAEFSRLLRAVAVSGFAAGNIMLLSVSVWSGAEGATRDLFHYVSALIAIPALIFAGGIFYRSAWSALSHGRVNMDLPIAVGVTLAYAMSIHETVTHGPHAYFDAAVSLLFFLLIGRTLDHAMRNRARSAVLGLARLSPRGALVLLPDGSRDYRQLGDIAAGDRLLVAVGERIPVDARIETGASDLDLALVTGESTPVPVTRGVTVRAGGLNLTGPLTLQALRPASGSFLAEMLAMLEAAEGGRARYRRIAERVSTLYAPVVHLGALVTFFGWMAVGGDWHFAMTTAIAVLIITCPCALGLAVPIVQVVAARRLFEAGIMVKDGSGLERLAEANHVVLDKTGTLTLGRPRLVNGDEIDPRMLAVAAALAAHSRHPFSRALATAGRGTERAIAFDGLAEHPGQGIEGRNDEGVWRLGRPGWASEGGADGGTVLSLDGREVARFAFEDRLRPGAAEAVDRLARLVGLVEMLSGDAQPACRQVAGALGIEQFQWALLPAQKVERIVTLGREGHRVLMVGDGLNDAPALAAAHVSAAPATAADVGRSAADFVFLRDGLGAVPLAVEVARKADRLIRQNIALAIGYNVVAVPIAVLGHATPLVAAIAMSLSSLLVVANALRLARVSATVEATPARTIVAPA
ncbi:MAG: cadmium-translocating P-type ATPase [Rhizobiaceae bacterium]|nr:cadmium-translocating P-type ATPase [Rhizobiaceae bacterium]MCV0407433.1 cadmium-translocating P-type ATPase [Rhizobiaceae bacterium]